MMQSKLVKKQIANDDFSSTVKETSTSNALKDVQENSTKDAIIYFLLYFINTL